MTLKKTLFLTVIATLAINNAVRAQTTLGSPGKRAPLTPNQLQASSVQSAQMPVSKKVIKQAKQQVNGEFGTMDRSSVGGQIQPVWDESQMTEGFYQYNECSDCIYKVRVREFMVTTLILPKGIEVHSFDVGDPAQFQVSQRADNMLAVQAAGGGVDTNVIIYTTEGEVFPFYIRAENFNSTNVPDLVVKVNGTRLPKTPIIKTSFAAEGMGEEEDKSLKTAEKTLAGTEPNNQQEAAIAGLQKKAGTTSEAEQREAGKDFVEKVGFDPDKLRGYDDYELWGDDELRPEMVFRDDHFTYIKFGKKWNDVDLPAAYVVVDGIDELVNTRVQGTTFIIESTKHLISLKSGQKYLCIKYEGDV